MHRPTDRYRNLYEAIDQIKERGTACFNFLEIGTYNGNRAIALMQYWHAIAPGVPGYYYGFDLFEALTPEMSKAELSKTKLPPSLREAGKKLNKAGIMSALWGGNTRESLPRNVPHLPEMDLIFVDGGHSPETIQSDWEAIQPIVGPRTIVLLDDYYPNRTDYGCQALVTELDLLDAPFDITLLDPLDTIPTNKMEIRMVRITRSE